MDMGTSIWRFAPALSRRGGHHGSHVSARVSGV
jgi:hypothetical protein